MLQLWNNPSDDDILDYFSDVKKFKRNYFDLIMCNFSFLMTWYFNNLLSQYYSIHFLRILIF